MAPRRDNDEIFVTLNRLLQERGMPEGWFEQYPRPREEVTVTGFSWKGKGFHIAMFLEVQRGAASDFAPLDPVTLDTDGRPDFFGGGFRAPDGTWYEWLASSEGRAGNRWLARAESSSVGTASFHAQMEGFELQPEQLGVAISAMVEALIHHVVSWNDWGAKQQRSDL